jgi:hypothetical protein
MADKKKVFYSFHYDNDVFRVQQIRNMGVIEGNSSVSVNEWETVKKGGDAAIEKWIADTMKSRDCVVVLIGEDTHKRKWVKHEIQKAWTDKKGLIGVYIHNLNCPKNGKCSKGINPFEQFTFSDGTKLSTKISCYNPNPSDAYNDIDDNLTSWIEKAIKDRQ